MAALFLEKAHLKGISCVQTGSPSYNPLMPNDGRGFGLIWHCVGQMKGEFSTGICCFPLEDSPLSSTHPSLSPLWIYLSLLMYKWWTGIYLLPGPLFIALTHPSSINMAIRLKKQPHWFALYSLTVLLTSMASLYVDIVSRLLPSLPSKPLPRSSRHLISPSPLLHLFLQPHLNKISWEFPYSINRSGHVQAPASPAYSSSSPPSTVLLIILSLQGIICF